MRLIVSPNMSKKDIAALKEGVSTPSEMLETRLRDLLGEAKVSTSALVTHTLQCLAYLLSVDRLQMRIVWLKNGGLFHPKVWFFRDATSTVVAHGSSNFTSSGLTQNHEQVRVEASWRTELAVETIEILTQEFEALWHGSRDYAMSLELPVAIKKDLLNEYSPNNPPTPDDFSRAWDTDAQKIQMLAQATAVGKELFPQRLSVPHGISIESGRFGYQGTAVANWERAGRRGILAMATGSGKTITALSAAARLQYDCESLLIVVSAPYRPLVNQWIDEVAAFGVEAVSGKGSAREKTNRLDLAVRSLVSKISNVQVAVVTQNYLTSSDFRNAFDAVPKKIKTLLIADEVHNLGGTKFISNPPERFDYRLGLSATPERQYDPAGTRALFDFFGEKVFEFPLAEAIGVCLVPYNYYLHRVRLTGDEFEEWERLTALLTRAGFGERDQDPSESGRLPSRITALLNKRRNVIESAENKVRTLRHILGENPREKIQHTLVYATDKGRAQLLAINKMLQNELHLTIHQLTAQETQKRQRASNILDRFASGDYHAITCMRVLDEGVDIPQVSTGYLLASNTVKRQWIQRRGRILRRCDAIGKRLAHLHDFAVIPPNPADRGGRAILKAELDRAQEFAELAENAGSKIGPFDQIERMMNEMYA